PACAAKHVRCLLVDLICHSGHLLEKSAAHLTPGRQRTSPSVSLTSPEFEERRAPEIACLYNSMHMELVQLRPSRVSTATKSRLTKGVHFSTIPATCR